MLSPQWTRKEKKKFPTTGANWRTTKSYSTFFPHSSCAFNNKKKTERETNFCTLYNYNVFVA